VKGEGPIPCRVCLIGEGPGQAEVAVGRPFVQTAPSGAELTRYFNGIALPLREDVYITNLIKAWEGGASAKVKDVTPVDVERDEWELHVELDEVHPEIVVCLGRHAARWMLNAEVDLEAVHGLLFEVRYCPWCGRRVSRLSLNTGSVFIPCLCENAGVDLVRFWVLPVYHPAAGLHQPELAARTAYGFAQLSAILKTPWTEWGSRAWTPSGSGSYTEYDGTFAGGEAKPAPEQGLDTEGTPDAPWGVSLSWAPGHAQVVRFAECNGQVPLHPQNIPETRWIFHNYPWDARVLAAKGIQVDEDRFDDTLAMAYLLGVEPQGLKALALRHLGRVRPSYEETVGEWVPVLNKAGTKPLKKKKLVLRSLDEIDRKTATDYSGADADDTLSLKPILWQKVKDLGMEEVYEIDRKVLPLYSRMEAVGLPVDLQAYFAEAERTSADLESATWALKQAAFAAKGSTGTLLSSTFNPASPDQVADLLFGDLHLHAHKKTPTGKRFSTNDKYLQALVKEHPIVQSIIDWRELAKHKNTFLDPLLNYCREVDGEIRLFFNLSPFRVVSGRVAYKQPNVGALPKHSPLGKRFRSIIRAREGRRLGEWDLSQIELRVLALDAGSTSLIEAFKTGADLHGRTASKIFGGVPDDYKGGPKRVAAKAVNFSIPMGTTRYGLAEQMRKNGYPFPELDHTGIHSYKALLEAQAEVCDWWIKTVIADWGLTPYISEKHAEARRLGYVSDRWGRKRFLPSVLSPNKMVREEALRQAQAFGPQAGARGFMKQIEARVWREVIKPMQQGGYYLEGLLDGHDALLLEFQEDVEGDVTGWVTAIFNETFHEEVPVVAKGSVGQTWAEI
jgi:uracil-DNA glycosylase family 4